MILPFNCSPFKVIFGFRSSRIKLWQLPYQIKNSIRQSGKLYDVWKKAFVFSKRSLYSAT